MTTEAKNDSDLAYADTLWQSADKLRGSIDAADYKHVVLGLIFLKYISDAFQARRAKLKEELAEPTASTGKQRKTCWSSATSTLPKCLLGAARGALGVLQAQGKAPNIAKLIDDAMFAVERDNPKLKGKLPRDYARRGIASQRLGGLIDLIAQLPSARMKPAPRTRHPGPGL